MSTAIIVSTLLTIALTSIPLAKSGALRDAANLIREGLAEIRRSVTRKPKTPEPRKVYDPEESIRATEQRLENEREWAKFKAELAQRQRQLEDQRMIQNILTALKQYEAEKETK